MRLPKFNEFERRSSSKIDSFIKKVAIASDQAAIGECFFHVKSGFDMNEADETPLVIWGNFSFKSQAVNESQSRFVYNREKFPNLEEMYTSFLGESFVPKTITDRAGIRKLKFPIIAMTENENEEFKTLGKFKKSEKFFSKFREKINSTSKYSVIAFKEKPIHIEEKINDIPFDVDITHFNSSGISSVLKKIHEKYNLDFYSIDILESDSSLFLGGINTVESISPSLGLKLYETAYSDYYEVALPNWVKDKLFEKEVIPYYRKKYYDSLLLKPKHAINFKKYL